MHRGWVALIGVLALVLSACGTRVADDRFDALLTIDDVADGGAPAATPGSEVDDGGPSLAHDDGGGDAGGPVAGPRTGEPDRPRETGVRDAADADGPTGQERAPDDGATPASDEGAGEAPNQASDVGVTADTIRVGNLVSRSGPLGEESFGPSFFGANAYFTYLNEARGGVHGRTVEFTSCDDAEDESRNLACAQDLVEAEEIFAFVANNTRAYAAAGYVSENGVPDILGQPIGNEYWTYPTLYSVRGGGGYPRDGQQVGHGGKLYGSTQAMELIREEFAADVAAVLYFNVPISRAAGQHFADGLREVGFEVLEFEVNPVAPNFEARVEQMQQAGVEVVYDTMDINANRNLCRVMDRNGFRVEAKVTTTQGMRRSVAEYSHPCRESIVAVAEALPYSEDSNEEVALFQDVMSRVYGGQFDAGLAQTAWEGWLAARSFAKAVEEMGPEPTRRGLMAYYDRQDGYTSGGVLSPLDWKPWPFDETRDHENCIVISQWNESNGDFERLTPVPHCEVVRHLPWDPA